VPINISCLSQSIHWFWDDIHLLQNGYNEREQREVQAKKNQGQHGTDVSMVFQIDQLLNLMLIDAADLQNTS
jgi:hypothetical protein